MQTFCQWLIVVNLLVSFMYAVYIDIHGRKSKEPLGFKGFVGSCVSVALIALVVFGAGGFSALFGK